jgi:hypothetical protein
LLAGTPTAFMHVVSSLLCGASASFFVLLGDALGGPELAGRGRGHELVVGPAVPEQVREPRGELEAVEGDDPFAVGLLAELDAVEEVGRLSMPSMTRWIPCSNGEPAG